MGELDPIAVSDLEARIARLEQATAYQKALFRAASAAMFVKLGEKPAPSDTDIQNALVFGFLTSSDVATYKAPAPMTKAPWWRRAWQRIAGRAAGDAA